VVGAEQVMGGVAIIAATIGEPGVIVHTGTMARLCFGPVLPGQRPAAEAMRAALEGAGVDAEVVPDVRRALWEKFVFLVALSGLTAISGQPLGVVRSDPELRAQFEAAMVEAWSLARVRGVALADDFVAAQMRFADTLPHEMRSSMLNDLVAGNRLEAPWLCGAVERMAKPLRVATPINNAIHAALVPYCDGRHIARPKETA
jgi:2-dehydropantoate 2-reductase